MKGRTEKVVGIWLLVSSLACYGPKEGWTVGNIKVPRLVTSEEFSASGIAFNNPGIIDLFS